MTPFKSHTNAQPENDNSVSQNETNKQTAEFSVGENISPEISSYVFQSLQELEPYTTHNTQVAVIAKDPAKLASRYRAEGIQDQVITSQDRAMQINAALNGQILQ